jgi:Lipopolysaccharide-assembly
VKPQYANRAVDGEQPEGRSTVSLERPKRGSRATARVVSGLAGGLAVLASLACGYHLVGTSSNFPARLKNLYVAPFVNRTPRAELDQRITEEITQEWVRRGRFQVVSKAEDADVVLSGTVTGAATQPVRFDTQGRATEYILAVSADVEFVDRTGQKPVVLWRDPHFVRTITYDVDVSSVNYFDREVEAMQQVAQDFARGLVVTIMENF